jgi:hypothetical protein
MVHHGDDSVGGPLPWVAPRLTALISQSGVRHASTGPFSDFTTNDPLTDPLTQLS